MVASPFLAEVLTGSTPVTLFFTPIVFLLFVTVGYGIPVLIIRELYVRYSLSFASLFFLGFAYGVVNEGLFAQTIFHPFHAPIPELALYGLVENVRIPFLLVISSWHALYAVVFPILLVHWLFPAVATTSWASKRLLWALGLLSLAFGSVGFFQTERAAEFPDFPEVLTGSVGHYLFLWCMWIGCGVLAWVFGKRQLSNRPFSSRWLVAVLAGGLFVAMIIVPTVLAAAPVPLAAFYAYFCGVIIGCVYFLARVRVSSPVMQMAAVWGGEATLATFGVLMAVFLLANPIQGVVVGGFLAFFLYKLVRRSASA